MSNVNASIVQNVDELVKKVVYTEKQIGAIVDNQAKKILNCIENNKITDVVFIAVKNGAIPYFNKLVSETSKKFRQNRLKIRIVRDSILVKSYSGTKSGELQILEDIKTDIINKFVYVIEDIYDTGKTLDFLYKHLLSKNPKSIRFSIFLKRNSEFEKDYHVDIGTYFPNNDWLIGFGLDYFEKYRELPYIASIKDKYKST